MYKMKKKKRARGCLRYSVASQRKPGSNPGCLPVRGDGMVLGAGVQPRDFPESISRARAGQKEFCPYLTGAHAKKPPLVKAAFRGCKPGRHSNLLGPTSHELHTSHHGREPSLATQPSPLPGCQKSSQWHDGERALQRSSAGDLTG